jgi:lipopolysaccharide export system protein LptA
MARSRPNRHSLLAAYAGLAALAALVLPEGAIAASLGNCGEPIEVEGDNLGANLKQSSTELVNVSITFCDTSIQADRARVSRLDFEDSSWAFEGEVKIRMDAQRGSLTSDQAVVKFRDNQIERVTITGRPAQFEQKRTDSDAIARGRAGEIVYELSAGTVSLSKDAWLSDGNTEIKGNLLVYDIRQQQVQASSKPGSSQRVRVTIMPGSSSKDGKAPAEGKAVTPAPTGPTKPR